MRDSKSVYICFELFGYIEYRDSKGLFEDVDRMYNKNDS